MGSLFYLSFSILINGFTSSFFRPGCGLRQGCPLALLLFLIVVEGLGRAILDARDKGDFIGLPFGKGISLTHVLFVDGIVMVSDGSDQSLLTLNDVLCCFCKASGMLINEDKFSLLHAGLDDSELIKLRDVFSFPLANFELGLK